MKIAVIGTGPLAIEMAILMHRQDAEVVIFGKNDLGGSVARHTLFSFLSMEGRWSEVTTQEGREIAGLEDNDNIPSLEEYHRLYLKKLISYCEENITIKKYDVERVQKRFLNLQSEIPGKSRLEDLFRVVHTREDEEGKIEFFDDFDIVIEAIGFQSRVLAGPSGGYAINEKMNVDGASYLLSQKSIEKLLEFKGTVAIVGDGIEAGALLLLLKSWLGLYEENNIYLIQDGDRPFDHLELHSPNLDGEVTKFINDEKIYWQQKCREVELEIESYRNLPREEQIKFRIPEFPDPRLKILTGYTVTSIDKLTDREGLFLTLETPSWKDEGNREIFTINCGEFFVLKGANPNFLAEQMRVDIGPLHSEPGYYTIGQQLLQEKKQYLLKEALPSIGEIRDNILSFFTRVNE